MSITYSLNLKVEGEYIFSSITLCKLLITTTFYKELFGYWWIQNLLMYSKPINTLMKSQQDDEN